MADLKDTNMKSIIDRIESGLVDSNIPINANRINVRHFMLFFTIGLEEFAVKFLTRNLKGSLQNTDAFKCMSITETSLSKLESRIEEELLDASNRHVDVEDLNNISVVLILHAANKETIGHYLRTTKIVKNYAEQKSKQICWLPFLILQREAGEAQIDNMAIESMTKWISDRENECGSRCCLLSHHDENGFEIPSENILRTIAVTAALQNLRTTNEVSKSNETAQSIRAIVRIEETSSNKDHLFYTTRSVTIENPIRSIAFQLINCALDYFSGETDETSKNVIKHKMQFSFIGKILHESQKKLPYLDGEISFLPLYGVMAGPYLSDRLGKTANDLYFNPLFSESSQRKMTQAATTQFLISFFQANGAIGDLQNVTRESFPGIPRDLGYAPPIEKDYTGDPIFQQFKNSAYKDIVNRCRASIEQAGIRLYESVIERITSKELQSRISGLNDTLSEIKRSITERIRQLQSIETVLVVGQTEQYSELKDVQRINLLDRAADHKEWMKKMNDQFDGLLCKMLLTDSIDAQALCFTCLEAIRPFWGSNQAFLSRLSEACINKQLVKEYVEIIRSRWNYSLRFNSTVEAHELSCVIGDVDNNMFCKELESAFKAKSYSIPGYDRIEVLRISESFSPEVLWERTTK